MTKKERTIKAIKEIIDLYEKFDVSHNYFYFSECPLCKIHGYKTTKDDITYIFCKGCPLANSYGSAGCYMYLSFMLAKIYYANYLENPDK